MPDDPKKRFLSPQARQASIKTRRLAAKPPTGTPQIFVVRHAGAQPFGWEIRKFGSFVLSQSETGFATQLLAQKAGENALASLAAFPGT